MKILIQISLWSFILISLTAGGNTKPYQITRLNVPKLKLGEGPHWDVATQSLYYVDITDRTINCYKYHSQRVYTAKIDNEAEGGDIGFITPVKGRRNEFVIGQGTQIVRIRWDSVSPTFHVIEVLIETEDVEVPLNRINDGKADRSGRLYFGTMNKQFNARSAYFYMKAKNRALVQILSSVGTSNGIAWNRFNNKIFYIDSSSSNVQIMDYNRHTGDVGSPSVYIDFGALGLSIPDGMTIDIRDYLYVAVYNGNGIYRVNPNTRAIDMVMLIPQATNTSSAAFGGPGLNELFVTSGSGAIDPNSPAFADAGGLYKIRFRDPTIRGFPMDKVEL